MGVNTEATVEDLYRVPGKAELVDGKLVRRPPAEGLHGYAAGAVFASLRAFTREHGCGHALPDNVAFRIDLPGRKSFSPDAAFYIGALTMKFVDGPPVFAVEVRSEKDYGPAAERVMARKRADYFAAGTLVVWDVDLYGEDTVRSFRAEDPEAPIIFRWGETASAEPAVPGWTMPVDDLRP